MMQGAVGVLGLYPSGAACCVRVCVLCEVSEVFEVSEGCTGCEGHGGCRVSLSGRCL